MWETVQQALGLGDWSDHAAAVWGMAAILFAATIFGLALLKRVLFGRLERLDERTDMDAFGIAAQVVERTNAIFYVAVGLLVATTLVETPEGIASLVDAAIVIALFLQLGLWLSEAVAAGVERYNERLDSDPEQASALSVVRILGRMGVWAIIALLVLDNLGFDIVTLVAGLGIGGVAVALAVQNILGDLFASLSILVDKPFVVGDFIIVGDQMGTVEKVGLKTTRLRSLGGEQIIFSNNDLLQSRVHNYKRMEERRVVFEFGVVYQTPTAQLEQIPDMVRQTIEGHDDTRFDRVHFKAFGDSSLRFEVVYYVLSAEYLVYMDVQESINLNILEFLRDEGIELAYPTRTVHMAEQVEQSAPVDSPATASA